MMEDVIKEIEKDEIYSMDISFVSHIGSILDGCNKFTLNKWGENFTGSKFPDDFFEEFFQLLKKYYVGYYQHGYNLVTLISIDKEKQKERKEQEEKEVQTIEKLKKNLDKASELLCDAASNAKYGYIIDITEIEEFLKSLD
jgi:S-methylmethionine-dependent homocysteine/selenocysteine methylase